jgi:hypothetical protein
MARMFESPRGMQQIIDVEIDGRLPQCQVDLQSISSIAPQAHSG